MKTHALVLLPLICLGASLPGSDALNAGQSGADWAYYNGNPNGTHYSTLTQITPGNVHELQVAWRYDTGDAFSEGGSQSDMEVNPLIVDGRIFFVSPKGRLIALDGATGKLLWAYDPANGRPVNTKARSRGVSYWSHSGDERILFTFESDLLAVDARTGKPIQSFGDAGRVDLRQGLGRDPALVSVSEVSPGVVYRDLIILGSTGFTPGHVRAYDVRTGKIRWVFHTIPQPGEYGYRSWPKDAWKTANGANVWAGMTLDPQTGTVFLPVASAGMADKDFYGSDRPGDNLFGTSLVALDATSGKRLWHFQFVRHDLWDRDPPTAPTLVTVRRNGTEIPAVAQVTKAGLVYVLDRRTGKSLFPLRTLAVPPSDVPGEQAAPAQEMPLAPAPFARQRLTENTLTRRTPQAHAAVLKQFRQVSSRGPFDPPSLKGTILLPGMDGGAEWGGAAWDPETGLLYINANEMAWIVTLKARPQAAAGVGGQAIYQNNCAACHGAERQGAGSEFPNLQKVGQRLSEQEIVSTITKGRGRMPSFGGSLSAEQINAVARFLTGGNEASTPGGRTSATTASRPDAAFVFDGYHRFLDPDGYPAVSPPWGTLSALDLNSGRYVWRKPLGRYPELAARGMTNTGSENYGGAVVTKAGVLFIAATVYDNKFRAFDKKTGRLLWETTLPAAGLATPATYSVGGRQFVVIAAGGGKNGKARPGGQLIAFALPRK